MDEVRNNGAPYEVKMAAARLGCGQCDDPVTIPMAGPAGDPFSEGPWRGRYLCGNCWTLYFDEHPEHLADRSTVEYIKREAAQIKLERATRDAEVVFREGDSRVFLTGNGTMIFRLEKTRDMAGEEYDPARFELLARAMKAVHDAAVPGFVFEKL